MIDLRRVLHPFWSACCWFPANIAFGTWCFTRVKPYHSFLGSTVWFLYEPLGPTVGQLQLSNPPPPPPAPPTKKKKKKDKCSIDKCSGEMGMVDIDWAIKERLRQKKSRDSRGTVDMGHFLSREVRVEIDRQCWTDLNSISGVRI